MSGSFAFRLEKLRGVGRGERRLPRQRGERHPPLDFG